MLSPSIKTRTPLIGAGLLLFLITVFIANSLTAQSVSNERRNRSSTYDQTRGDYYTGRSPYVRNRELGNATGPELAAQPASQSLAAPRGQRGFGPSHSRVDRDGIEYVVGSMSFPTGLRDHDGLLVEKIVPAEMMVGAPFTYEYRVTNLTSYPIQQVRLMDQASDGMEIQKADPQPASTSGGLLIWEIGKLDGNESRKVRVQAVGTDEGVVTTCGWATYLPILCEPIRIVRANLQVVIEGPDEASICDPIQYVIRVKNSGSSRLTNVRVIDQIEPGLSVNGEQQVGFDVGALEPGETREMTVNARGTSTGRFASRVEATSAQGVSATDQTVTNVVAPALQLTCEAPDIRFIGRPVELCFNLNNPGTAIANNVEVEAALPEGATVTGLTEGGRVAGDRIFWELGSLPPGESINACARLTFDRGGVVQLAGRAGADCIEPVSTACQTEIRGVPGVLLEVVDIDDPIEVGATDTYEIAVTNQGTAMDTNIQIECRMEAAQEFVSTSGATQGGEVEPKVIRFEPLPTLAPKQTARWRVVVRAVAREDVRFKVILTTDQISRPVEETEATNQY